MGRLPAEQILPGDVIGIPGHWEHEDLAGLQLEVGVLAVAQQVDTKELQVYPNDSYNPAPYSMSTSTEVTLLHRNELKIVTQ